MWIALVGWGIFTAVSVGFNIWFARKYRPWTALGRYINEQIDEWQRRIAR